MTALDLLLEAGGAAWAEDDAFAAHEWWETAWRAQPAGPLKEGLRGVTQWAVAAHLDRLGRWEAAQTIRERARARLRRTENRLALAPWALDLPSDDREDLALRPQNAAFSGVTAILLAAGHGRRAGGPKALAQIAGEPLWRRQVERLHMAGLTGAIAVLHPAALPAQLPGVRIVAGHPDATPLHSLQRALALIDGPALLLPIDCPAPARGVIARLLACPLVHPGTLAARPVVHDADGARGGHPVWLAAELCADLRRLDPDQHRLDLHLRALGPLRRDVPVRDAGVLANFNLDGTSR